jgi:hypothetical protein
MRATAIVFTLGLLAAPAFAEKVDQAPVYRGDLHGFSGDPAALPRAIAAIEAQGPRVMEIRYDGAAGPGYQAVLSRDGKVEFDHAAEPASGVTVIADSSVPVWMLPWRGRAEVKAVRKTTVDLPTAVRTAEAKAGGAPAVAAGIAAGSVNTNSEVKAYNVLVREDGGGFRRIMIDANNDSVIANPGAMRPWP